LPTLSVTFLPKILKSIHVYQSYSKPTVGRFLRHGVQQLNKEKNGRSYSEQPAEEFGQSLLTLFFNTVGWATRVAFGP